MITKIQDLAALGRTLSETSEIARDVAKKPLEAGGEPTVYLISPSDKFEFPLIIRI